MVSDLEEQMDARVAYLVGLCTPIIYSYFPELYTSEKDKTQERKDERNSENKWLICTLIPSSVL